jgi:hypothetical protein
MKGLFILIICLIVNLLKANDGCSSGYFPCGQSACCSYGQQCCAMVLPNGGGIMQWCDTICNNNDFDDFDE